MSKVSKDKKDALVDLQAEYQDDPFRWIEDALGMTPQRIKKEYEHYIVDLYNAATPEEFSEIAAEMNIDMFHKHQGREELTWHQVILVIAVKRCIANPEWGWKIFVRSARGAGKSFIAALLIFYYLYCFPESKLAATSSSSNQLKDALWSEANAILSRMNEPFKSAFEWQSEYIRLKESPGSRWARARTATKENPEAMAGFHAPIYQGAIAEEASAIPEAVWSDFRMTMSASHPLLVAISNPTRLEGTFYEAFKEEGEERAVLLHFSGLESPIFDYKIEEDAREKYGVSSNEYKISVLGEFPDVSSDGDIWWRFFSDDWIDKVLVKPEEETEMEDPDFKTGRLALGVDPAGDGSDATKGVLRSYRWAKTVFSQQKSSTRSVSAATHGQIDNYPNLNPYDVIVDAFGIGHDVGMQVMEDSPRGDRRKVNPINTGDACDYDEHKARYINKRAAFYDALRVWGNNGGKIISTEGFKRELKSIRAKKTGSGKLKIMGKRKMRKEGYPSPDEVDALTLSFGNDYANVIDGIFNMGNRRRKRQTAQTKNKKASFNRNSMIP